MFPVASIAAVNSHRVRSAFVGALDGVADAILTALAPGVRLLSSWTGDLLTVRRDSDSSEADFGSVNGRLDTASLTTWLAGANPFTARLYDQSGNGRNFANATAANQPSLDLSDVDWNNLATSIFDGVTDSLSHGSAMQPVGFLVAWKHLGGSSFGRVFSGSSGNSSIFNLVIGPTNTYFRVGNNTLDQSTAAQPISRAEFYYDDEDTFRALNGVETAFPAAAGFPFENTVYTLGDYTNNGGQTLDMSLAYFVSLSRVLTPSERTLVRANLDALFK